MSQNYAFSSLSYKKNPEILHRVGDNFPWTRASQDLLSMPTSLHKTLKELAKVQSKNPGDNISAVFIYFHWVLIAKPSTWFLIADQWEQRTFQKTSKETAVFVLFYMAREDLGGEQGGYLKY